MPRNFSQQAAAAYIAPAVSGSPVVEICLRRILQSFRPYCVLLAGSAMQTVQDPNDLDFCILVTDRPSGRLRWNIADTIVDLFVERLDSMQRHIACVRPQHILSLFATARILYGGGEQVEKIQAASRALTSLPAPIPSVADRFRLGAEPFDLLRKFQRARNTDVASATFILSRLVSVCVDAFFCKERLWTGSADRVLQVIRERDAQAADALTEVLLTPTKVLCETPGAILRLVELFAGRERITTMTALRRKEWVS